jgi:hypothetical protein
MAKLSEKHPREAEIAQNLLAPVRSAANKNFPDTKGIRISAQRADELEMRICEALVEAFCRGVEAP